MIRVLLGLGSNKSYKGQKPLELLAAACGELSGLLVKPSFSSVYKTKAMYVEDQDDFFNMCVLGFVPDDFSPFELLKKINNIEAKYGRDRTKEIRFGQRPLDIDIELFGNVELNDPILQIPHPRVHERMFVLIPAIEVLKESADEIIRETYKNHLTELSKTQDINEIKKVVSQQAVLEWIRK